MMISNIDGKNITPEGAGKPARRVGEMIMPRQDTRVSPPPAQTEAPKTPEPEKDKGEKYVTVAEMQSKISQLLAGINSVIHSMSGRYALKTDVENALSGVLRNVNRDTVTRGEVESIAKQAVPKTIRDIDNSPRAGNVCLLSPGGASGTDSVYFGTVVSGLNAKGDKVLYKGVFLREYDANGTIVAAGSEINPNSYSTQALYEAALTAAGHTLKYTNDWVRAHQPTAW